MNKETATIYALTFLGLLAVLLRRIKQFLSALGDLMFDAFTKTTSFESLKISYTLGFILAAVFQVAMAVSTNGMSLFMAPMFIAIDTFLIGFVAMSFRFVSHVAINSFNAVRGLFTNKTRVVGDTGYGYTTPNLSTVR